MSNSTQQLKAEQRRKKFAELLRDMFQLNQPELDFGLYRIMHARKDDINRFIERDLPNTTKDAFKSFATQDKTQVEQELEKVEQSAKALGIDPETLPKAQELRAKLKDNFDLAREEGEVYDALVTFFNRYYDEGDFLSRRVYKDGTYAIPYQGEEVVLHWANKDQYYIKSSETLRDYTFRLSPNEGISDDPLRVHFKLVDAEAGAKDNNKESDESKRVFVLDRKQPFELIDGEPGEDGNIFQELQLRFHFRATTESDWSPDVKEKATAAAQKKAPTQDHLRTIAVNTLLSSDSEMPDIWQQTLKQPYRKSDGNLADYSILQGQLNNYTKKNSFDYFIHKDLNGFLTRELDFYIKNELLDWADIASLKNDTTRLAPLLSKIEVIRSLGEKIISFLAQLENFQKKLWLKKKFVTEANYCITLDRLAEHIELLDKIFDNESQLVDWKDLYSLDLRQLKKDYEALEWPAFLAIPKYRYLMIDTANFDVGFKVLLIATIDDLDEQCDGLLVHSENFQALNLLKERYREQVKCIYIDPPYNTGNDGFIYKDGYGHSSWLAMFLDRMAASYSFLDDNGAISYSLDDKHTPSSLSSISAQGVVSHLGSFVWRTRNTDNRVLSNLSTDHEYIHVLQKQNSSITGRKIDRSSYTNPYDDPRGPYTTDPLTGKANRADRPNLHYTIVNPDTGDVYEPDPDFGWITDRAGFDSLLSDDRVFWPRNPATGKPRKKRFASEASERAPVSTMEISIKKGEGNDDLSSIMGSKVLNFPKPVSVIKTVVDVTSKRDSTIMDFFAGSGTTGQSIINLNRDDSGERKYILVEMGDHFDKIICPRIKRVVYSQNWVEAKPIEEDGVESTGVSHLLKYVRLESYEDALGNLALNRQKGQQILLGSEDRSALNEARQNYVMNYMLEVETRGSQSLLNTQQFLDPNLYELKVRSASGDETKAVNVDLMETFNYLLGLRVEHIAAPIYFDAEVTQGEFGRWQAKVKRKVEGAWWFRTVFGTNANGQKVLVVWRNLPSVITNEDNGLQRDNAVLDAVLIEKLAIRLSESQDDEIDLLYVNGDHNIAIPRNRNGEPMEQARLQLIEEAFHRLMFAGTDSAQ